MMDEAFPVSLIRRTEIVRDNVTFRTAGRLFPFAGLEVSRSTSTASAQSPIEAQAAAQQVVVTHEWDLATSAREAPFAFARRRIEEVNEVLTSGSVLNVRRLTSTTNEIDGYGNVKDRMDVVYVGDFIAAFQGVTAEYDHDPARIDAWLIGLKSRQTNDEQLIGQSHNHDYEARTVSWDYDESGLLSEMIREPDSDADSSLYLRTTYHRAAGDVFQNVRSVEQSGNWRDGMDVVVGSRVTSFQYDEDGIFPRRTIQHVGEDCPIDLTLTDDQDEGLGSTCLLVEMSHDPRDSSLLGSVDNTGVGSQSAFDSFGRVRRQVSPTTASAIAYMEADAFYVGTQFIPATTETRIVNEITGEENITRFDGHGRVVQTERSGLEGVPLFQEYRYEWGSLVRTVSRPHIEGDASQGEVINRYDDRYRLTERRFPDDTNIKTYQATPGNTIDGYGPQIREALVTQHLNGEQRETVTFSDFRGAPTRIRDASGNETTYVHDAFGSLGRIQDALGHTTTILSDKLGRVVEHADQDTGIQTYQHTAFDEPFIHEDGVGSATPRKRVYSYDGVGRLVNLSSPDGDGSTSFEYDVGENARGRLVQATSPWGHVERFEYQPVPADRDPMGNLALLQKVTRQIAGESFATNYDYENGRLARVSYPESAPGQNFALRYTYDSVGNLNGITGTSADGTNEDALFWRRDSAYHAQFTETETLGDTLTTTYRYHDKNARLLALTTGSSPTDLVQDIQHLEHDDNGNLLHRTTALKEVGSNSLVLVDEGFGYDALDRLQTIRIGSEVATIVMDEIGNIKSMPGVGEYIYDEPDKPYRPHAVQGVKRDNVKVVDLRYDDYGNVEYRAGGDGVNGSQQIAFTSFNLPVSVTFSDGRELTYEYDASDHRVLESTAPCGEAVVTCFERISVGGVYEREVGTDQSGSFTRHTYRILDGTRLLAEVVREQRDGSETEQRRYIHSDVLGSPQVITDSTGAVVATRRYSAFGRLREPSQDQAPVDTRSDFTGHMRDRETGLVDMGGRTYDALLGRFLQADPLGMEDVYHGQALNRYSYVANNPIMRIDPTGFEGQVGGDNTAQAWPEELSGVSPGEWSGEGGHGSLCWGNCSLPPDQEGANVAEALWLRFGTPSWRKLEM